MGNPKGRGSGREYVALGSRRIDGKARRARVSVLGSAANQRVNCACSSFILALLRTKLHFGLLHLFQSLIQTDDACIYTGDGIAVRLWGEANECSGGRRSHG